jgi:hypothetical protein
MGKRRAAGGGRKPKGEFAGVTSPLSIRMPAAMREQLDSSARENGRSVSQEVLRRIQESFYLERDKVRDPSMRALCFLIAQLAGHVAGLTDAQGRPAFNWRTDRFFFQAFKLAVAKVLDALEPSGEIRSPKDMFENRDKDENGIRLFEMVKATYETPEARADAAARTLLSTLKQPSFNEYYFDEIAPNHKRSGLQDFYGFLDARRDLQLKTKATKS